MVSLNEAKSFYRRFIIIFIVFAGILSFNLNGISLWSCPFHYVTGYSCPGCGITRGVIAIMRGNFTEAAKHNLNSFPISIVITISFILFIFDSITKRTTLFRTYTTINRIISTNKPIILFIIVYVFLSWLFCFKQIGMI